MSCDDCSFPYSLCQCPGVKLPPPKDEPMRFLVEVPPLTGTLDKSEVEHAAALILYGLHVLGRPWGASIGAKELGKVMQDAKIADSKPVKWWSSNPFFRPDIAKLIELGFATKEVTADGDVLTLTPATLERVAAHIVPFPVVSP